MSEATAPSSVGSVASTAVDWTGCFLFKAASDSWSLFRSAWTARESSADKADSPSGTLWAKGTVDNIDNLTFRPFRIGVGQPKAVVGSDLVLYLVEDNVYITVKFTSWSQGQKGGFAYQRSSQ